MDANIFGHPYRANPPAGKSLISESVDCAIVVRDSAQATLIPPATTAESYKRRINKMMQPCRNQYSFQESIYPYADRAAALHKYLHSRNA